MLSDDIGSFAWNEAKSERCRLERGFSFAFVIPAFGDPDRRIEIDDRRNYGETRYRPYGRIAGRLFGWCIRCALAPSGSFRPARRTFEKGDDMATRARLKGDGTVVEVLRDGSERPLVQEVDLARVDATTEAEIAEQIAEDDAEAMRDAAAYARRVRRKIGLSQVAFAQRIGVPVDTVRNWEQGKRAPQGPARALLRIIDRAPEAALAALDR